MTVRTANKGISKKSVTTIRVDDDLMETFKAVCEQEGYPMSFVMRQLIKNYVKDKRQTDLFKIKGD